MPETILIWFSFIFNQFTTTENNVQKILTYVCLYSTEQSGKLAQWVKCLDNPSTAPSASESLTPLQVRLLSCWKGSHISVRTMWALFYQNDTCVQDSMTGNHRQWPHEAKVGLILCLPLSFVWLQFSFSPYIELYPKVSDNGKLNAFNIC